ncbi:MAG: hypothetical protein IKB28_11030 [Clostridia bacterium]|nr:hypothetical protein [Oscillospiraceae bacterium]MBR2447180.1 hypothetical protein [Clostridia bacterium]
MAWYNTPGYENDTVIFSRITLTRNLEKYPFVPRISPKQAAEIIASVGGMLETNGFTMINFSDISPTAAASYAEKYYVTKEFASVSLPHALLLNEPCNLSVMLGGRDHVQICCTLPGLSLQDAAANAFKMDDLIDDKETYAFDGSLGYLCSDPLECGTAMRAYALLFLPALTLHDRIEPLCVKLSGLGISLRPLLGSTQTQSCLYMLSCRSSLRASEQEILARMEETTRQILDSEHKLCEQAKKERAPYLTDRALRARAILGSAHLLGADEFLNLSADVRLGISLGILQDIEPDLLNTLLVEIMPCTMTLSADQPLRSVEERDLFRAALVRQRLGA